MVVATVFVLRTPQLSSWLGAGDPVAYDEGDRIDVPSPLYARSDVTALLFVRSNCAVCQDTKPLYAEVIRELRTLPGAAILAVIRRPVQGEDTAYAAELGLDATEYAAIDFTSLRLRRVPTLVIVDRTGRIVHAWEGAPPVPDRDGFAATVRSFYPH
jgi:hypothetical protein